MTLTKATIKRLELKGNQKHDDWLKDWAKTIDEIRKQVKERAVLIVNQD